MQKLTAFDAFIVKMLKRPEGATTLEIGTAWKARLPWRQARTFFLDRTGKRLTPKEARAAS